MIRRPFRTRRSASVGLAAALVVSTVVAVLSTATPSTAAPNFCGSTGERVGSSCVYKTRGTDTFTVPGYIASATFTVYGAGVISGSGSVSGVRYGGMSKGTLSVSQGQTYQINVGGEPTGGDESDIAKFGGFNGGGDSGATSTDIGCCSLGGAGASDVRVGSHGLTDRIFVAGGAGGVASEASLTSDRYAFGGNGGGSEGQNGDTLSGSTDGTGGGGGNQNGAGASPGNAGSAGRGFGGSGGPDIPDVATGGAGGGGGYYGGGGSASSFGTPGGGGGGSGYITPLATNTSSKVGGQQDVIQLFGEGGGADGQVHVSWSSDPIVASVALTSNQTSPVAENTLITFTTRVTTSTGVLPQGTILLIDNNLRNVAQGTLEPTDDGFMEFVFKKNSDTFTPGSHSIVAKYEDSFGIIANASSPSVDFSLAPRSQTVTFTSTAPTNALADGSTYAVAATATSGLPVTFVLDSPSSDGVCTVSGSTVTFIGVGTCGIHAVQHGDSTYSAAPLVTQTFTVAEAKSQKITFTSTPPTDATFGDTYTVSATGGASGNPVTFSVGENRSCDIDGNVVTIVDFECQIHADQAAGNGYTAAPRETQTIVLPEQAQTITFTTTAPTNPQIGDTYTVKAKADSTLPVTLALDAGSAGCTKGTSTVTSGLGGVVTSALITFTGVGSCIVNADRTGLAGYYLAAPRKTQTMTVQGGAQEISFTSEPPSGAKYGGSTTVAATGGASGNPVTFSTDSSEVCEVDGSTVSFVGVGDCVVDADQEGNDLYPAAETVSQTIAVGKAPLVVVAPSPFVVYGIDPGSFDPTYETLVNGDTAPDTPATCAPAQSTFTAVGRYAIVCTGAGDANYDISYQPGTLVVTRAPITVTAKPVASKYALASSRLTLSATVKHATTGAAARGIPVTFTTRSAFGRTITCKNTTNLNGVATCTTGYAFFATPSAYNAVATATHNYVGGSGTAAITFVGQTP